MHNQTYSGSRSVYDILGKQSKKNFYMITMMNMQESYMNSNAGGR